MTYKLYNRKGSGGFVVEAALTLAGAPFELITIESEPGSDLAEEFRATNPWRQVPVLMTPEGGTITESAAMLVHIAQTFPGEDIGPDPGASEFSTLLRWVVFLSVNVYEGTLRRIYPERFTKDAGGYDGVRAAAVERNDEAFVLIDKELRSGAFLLGPRMSVADVYLAMLFAWHPTKQRFGRCEALTHNVAAHTVIAPIWQRNFDHRLKVKWGRA